MYVQACACYFFDLKIIDIFSLAPLEKKKILILPLIIDI